MGKSNLQVPTKPSNLHRVLGQRGNVLQWFTQEGWDLIPHERRFNPDGSTKKIDKGGWVKVNPDDFEAPPAPLKPQDLNPAPPVDPKAVVETTGQNGPKTESGGDPKGDPGDPEKPKEKKVNPAKDKAGTDTKPE